jgi:tRNA (adenine37-N6)-methyltransferase
VAAVDFSPYGPHRGRMTDQTLNTEEYLRAGEVAVALPSRTDGHKRDECPKRGSLDGPVCSIVVHERWHSALTDIEAHRRIQVLYWMHQARRDLVLQTPYRTGQPTGSFALRSPVRPNPIASSVGELVGVDAGILRVRGLDCLDGTPLIDLKPDRTSND